MKSKETPTRWQNLAREKLIEITGYDCVRSMPKTVRIFKEECLQKEIFKKSFYLRVRKKTDIPVHIIYKKPLKQNYPVFIFLSGSTSGVHTGWGSKVVPIDYQRVAIGADLGFQAAKKGYLAVGIEQAGYGERGERNLWKRSNDRTIDASNHLLLLGKTLMGYGSSDISSVIDWLTYKNIYFNIDVNKFFLKTGIKYENRIRENIKSIYNSIISNDI